jgi:glycerol uptake facilitator-like aquaporin
VLMNKKLFAEFFGTLILLAVITGSGIMGGALSDGNNAVALLGNSIAILAPVSGAHFNPAVSLMFWASGELEPKELAGYCVAQFTGAIAGIWMTHLMFSLPIIQVSAKPREGLGILVSELAATVILLMVIQLGIKQQNDKVPAYVAMTVMAGYWFTSSTFFVNPAVTVARSLTDTFVGMRPLDILGFIAAQLAACCLVVVATKFSRRSKY